MANTKGSRKGYEPPQGAIRQSQVVTTFGPGAMVDLVHDAVLVGGLDMWSLGREGAQVVSEPRLRARVLYALQAQASGDDRVELSLDRPFLAPPAGKDDAPSRAVGIRALEFPRWFVCQSCRALVRKDQLEYKGHSYRHACVGRKNGIAVPVRFVAACPRGHLEDFPWRLFVHKDGQVCSTPQLRLEEGSSGDFSEVRVTCDTCQLTRRLSEAKAKEAMPRCTGSRPWLGTDAREDCDEKQQLIVRTASNSYFTQSMSALTIPDPDSAIKDKLAPVMGMLRQAERNELPILRKIPDVKLATEGYDDDEVWAAVGALKGKSEAGNEELRTPEFDRFMGEGLEKSGELPKEEDVFFARKADIGTLPKQLDRIVLAPKLREVRVQIGFTRLEAATANLQGEFDLGVTPARLGLNRDWLPATEIHGEGVLLVLNEEALAEWEARPEVQDREAELRAGYERWAASLSSNQKKPPFPGARFYMLHTLSHMLITAVSLDCGYAASAIRERLYCSLPTDDKKMAGILLSTGTSGSEGTLGGLVEQGRRIMHHLRHAWDLASLCSSDPVCGHHCPDGDYAERYLAGAACHSCLYIAECSCERHNRYLDRALVVPVIGQDRAAAFFQERPT